MTSTATWERLQSRPRYRWLVLWTVMGGLFSVNVTFTILAVALPRIAHDFHTSRNTMTWVITGPLLAFGVAAPSLGKAADQYGHKRVYQLGLILSFTAAGLSTLAWGALPLIVIRTIGSLEGAATGAASMAIVMRTFEREDRVKAMGWWSLVGAGGPVIGVVLGGFILQAIGWRAIFACQMPLIATAFVVGSVVLPKTETLPPQKFDVAGALTLSGGIAALLFAINQGPELGWSNNFVRAGFVVCPLLLWQFVRVERRSDNPLISLEYLKKPAFAFPVASNAFANSAYMGGFILTPALLQVVYHYSDEKIGLLVIARPLSFSILSPIAGYLAVRIGQRTSAVAGTLFVVTSMGVFALLGASSPNLLIILALSLSGVGLGVSQPSISAGVANAVADHDLGVASAAMQLMQNVGVVSGIQIMTSVQTSIGKDASGAAALHSFHVAYLVGGGLCAIGVLLATGVRNEHTRPELHPELFESF
ncbi:MAG TPA: MFS transporter [Acidimicrobiales bacterium]|nr:MFS transporter [Acidimicrobiales bacterium]